MTAQDKAHLLALLASLFTPESEYVIYGRQDLINIVVQNTNTKTSIFFRQVLRIVVSKPTVQDIVNAAVKVIEPLEIS